MRKQRSPERLRGISITMSTVALVFLVVAWLLYAVAVWLMGGPGIGMSANMQDYDGNALLWVLGIFFGMLGMLAPAVAALIGIGLGVGAIVTARKASSRGANVFAIIATAVSGVALVLGVVAMNSF